jgi:hypothetical protein
VERSWCETREQLRRTTRLLFLMTAFNVVVYLFCISNYAVLNWPRRRFNSLLVESIHLLCRLVLDSYWSNWNVYGSTNTIREPKSGSSLRTGTSTTSANKGSSPVNSITVHAPNTIQITLLVTLTLLGQRNQRPRRFAAPRTNHPLQRSSQTVAASDQQTLF